MINPRGVVFILAILLLAWSVWPESNDEQCADLTAQVYALQEQLQFAQEERQACLRSIAALQARVEALSDDATSAVLPGTVPYAPQDRKPVTFREWSSQYK